MKLLKLNRQWHCYCWNRWTCYGSGWLKRDMDSKLQRLCDSTHMPQHCLFRLTPMPYLWHSKGSTGIWNLQPLQEHPLDQLWEPEPIQITATVKIVEDGKPSQVPSPLVQPRWDLRPALVTFAKQLLAFKSPGSQELRKVVMLIGIACNSWACYPKHLVLSRSMWGRRWRFNLHKRSAFRAKIGSTSGTENGQMLCITTIFIDTIHTY